MAREILWHNISIPEIIKRFDSRRSGLFEDEVKKRLEKFGPNSLPEKKPTPRLKILFDQIKSPLIYILIIAGLIAVFFKEFVDAGVIFGAVVLNALIGFFQEKKANDALFKLKKLIQERSRVIRGGFEKEISREEIVPGDIIVLKSGAKVAADARLIEAKSLKVNEASLTGEWWPREKSIKVLPEKISLADMENMVFQGTVVEDGWGKAVVVATGSLTELGKIAKIIEETEEEKSPLQERVKHFSKILGLFFGFISLFVVIAGLLRGMAFEKIFTTAVAVAVAAIPEGLPVATTVILAIGMQRILRRKGLVRKLVAAETLGSTSIICTDKTGTLTEGKMSVSDILTEDEKTRTAALKILTLVNEAIIENPEVEFKKLIIRGRPTERAMLQVGFQAGFHPDKLKKETPELDFLPFNPERKFAAGLYKLDDNYNLLYVVGAPEIILAKSTHIKFDSRQDVLAIKKTIELKKKYEGFASKGYRVLGIAYKKLGPKTKKFYDHDGKEDLLEIFRNLTFIGFAVLRDPLRKETKKVIKLAKRAGLRPIIVTGDHKLTAKAIAEELGFKVKEDNIIEGSNLENMEEEEFDKRVEDFSIYARVSPKDKLRIIDAWQKRGEVVAMTGDGVNDAPALKKADIGVALGSGTDVAKETSDLVLLNDNFSIIVLAIREGRVIFDNLKKVITYLLTDSFTEVILIVGSLIIGFPVALLPAQILWVNLLNDGLPALALSFEPREKDVMKKKPISREASLLDREMKIIIFIIGIVTNLLLLGLFWWLFRKTGDIKYTRTMIFALIGVDSLFYIFSIRSFRQSIFSINLFSNRYLVWAVALGLLMVAVGIYIPLFQKILRTVPLGLKDWLIVFIFGLINIIGIELAKWKFIVKSKK